jgi:hypothetical protein
MLVEKYVEQYLGHAAEEEQKSE